MSSMAVFLVIGGATAFAALGKNTVGSKQLKKNAVTAAKIKKNAVATAKIKNSAVTAGKIANGAVDNSKLADNSVTGNKIADGSVTGADINAGSAPFSQFVARLRGNLTLPFTGGQIYPLGSYTQAAGQSDQYLAAVDVNFLPSCEPPRSANALLLIDAANPAAPTPNEIGGIGTVTDTSAGSAVRRLEFQSTFGLGGMSRFAPNAATSHTFSVLLSGHSCNSGSGANAVAVGVDVIGTK